MKSVHTMVSSSLRVLALTLCVTFLWSLPASAQDILIKGAQLAKIPLNHDVPVNTKTVIGRNAKKPLEIESPIYVSHMSFGALSREIKLALAKGSAAVKTAMCSGEGGILPESVENAHKYIFEYVPNLYSVTDEYLGKVDAIEIKIGQSVKPGMGGHLPANKVTKEIAQIRGVSTSTINRHRENIRRKLKITNSDVNLATYLQSSMWERI